MEVVMILCITIYGAVGGIADIIFDKKTSFPPSTRCHYGCTSYGVSGERCKIKVNKSKILFLDATLPRDVLQYCTLVEE